MRHSFLAQTTIIETLALPKAGTVCKRGGGIIQVLETSWQRDPEIG